MSKVENNRYKIRISEQPIFWTTNSVNHPSRTLWENTYLPTFVDLDCYINWIDVFTITSILDKTSYTMIELTDTVTNEVMYFLNNRINKKLSQGYEMEFVCDIYLTFGLAFYQWMIDNKLPIHLNRFLNNDVLKQWFKQFKFINQDSLLDYKKGIVKIDNNSPKISGSFTNYPGNFSNGELTNSSMGSLENITATNGFSNVIWVVVEDNNSNYYCIFCNSNSGNAGTTTLTLDSQSINVVSTFQNVMNIATSSYWIDKFVGIFIIPCWWFINSFCCLSDGTNKYLGFVLNRSGWLKLKTFTQQIYNPTYFSLEDSEFTTEDPNHPNGNTFVDYTNLKYISDDNHDYANFKLYFNPTQDDLVVKKATSDNSNQYIVNSYFFSQLRRENSVVQFSPINGFWSMFDNAILTFDGNNFNLSNTFKNTINMIDTYNGTMNVATSGYDAYLAGVKTNMNTNLQVAKSQIDLQTSQNNANNVMNSVKSFFSGIGDIFTGNLQGAINSVQGIVSSNVNTSYENQKLQLSYTNLQKQQDAQLATARLTSSAKNISSTNAEDDSIIKLLLSWYDTDKSITNNSLSTISIAYFISNINDLLFLHNLIYKNGMICDMFITSDIAFNDTTNINDFIYLDFVCDEDYIRFFAPNLPNYYIDALKIVCNNGLRIWDKVMDVTNMPVYYIDFLNQARNAFTELYITNNSDTTIETTTPLDVSLGYPVDDSIDTLHPEQFSFVNNAGNTETWTISYPMMASEYTNDQADWVKQVILKCFPQFSATLNIDESTIQVVNETYYNSLDVNTQNLLNSFDLGNFNNTPIELTKPNDYAGQVFYMVNLDHDKFGGDENNRVITNQSLWWIQDNQYMIKINAAGKLVDCNNLIIIPDPNTNGTNINNVGGPSTLCQLGISISNYYYPYPIISKFSNSSTAPGGGGYGSFTWDSNSTETNNYIFLTNDSTTDWATYKQINSGQYPSQFMSPNFAFSSYQSYTEITNDELMYNFANEVKQYMFPNNQFPYANSYGDKATITIKILIKFNIEKNQSGNYTSNVIPDGIEFYAQYFGPLS